MRSSFFNPTNKKLYVISSIEIPEVTVLIICFNDTLQRFRDTELIQLSHKAT